MKPAVSVILLTTLIGAGQGLFLAYFSAECFALLNILDPAPGAPGTGAALLCLGLLVAGLIASFFHLGHPERAWRAAAMWRTSWLSREVIALPLALALISAWGLAQYLATSEILFYLGNLPLDASTLLGFAALVAVLALFVCTAMIYACLPFLQQWHSPLTVLNFFLMGCASGFTLASLLSTLQQDGYFGYFSGMAVFLTLSALAGRWASLLRNRRLRSPSTIQSALGIHHPTIRQMAQGAMGGSFNTRAFMHDYGAGVVRLARRFFLVAGFILPAGLLWFAGDDPLLWCALAFASQYVGLVVERWYFFIEAEHPQNIYYQMIS